MTTNMLNVGAGFVNLEQIWKQYGDIVVGWWGGELGRRELVGGRATLTAVDHPIAPYTITTGTGGAMSARQKSGR